MIIGENMGGLISFDNTWYCDKCNENFKDEDDFIYCPYCGDVLKNDWYQRHLQSIEEFFNESAKSVCEDCGEEFDKEFNFCPLCSNELKKETIPFKIEKDNSITADWNGEKVCIFDKDMFISDPHFSKDTVIKCFEDKDYFDGKLEFDFKEMNLEPPEKLNYKETYSIASLGTSTDEIRGIKFVPELNEDILSDERFKPWEVINPINNGQCIVVNVRKNLYAKVMVEHVRVF